MQAKTRCPWVHDELDQHYHDTEWGVPEYDDAKLFEFIILEGMQAGLSWNLILKRRETMREAFDGFNPTIIAKYNDTKRAELLANPGVIRNRRKIDALIKNANAFLAVQKEFGSFSSYIWGFVGGKPIVNAWQTTAQVPITTEVSDAMSKDLKKRGFSFVGSTICYS
ncbi:DNA-3-methyladenine glycosylase I, partial [Ruminococcaceae bacterium OttesenSCG-928-A16]|nr:DNA-3-methyladenine glycosylase I [Ruminococcaceae bacterium OttesenSCG-928-A16]